MSTLQLRLYTVSGVWGLAEDLVQDIWQVCLRHRKHLQLDRKLLEALRQIVRGEFMSHVECYEACGKLPRCTTAIKPSEWTAPGFVGTRRQAIFLFKTEAGLENFVTGLEAELFEKISPHLPIAFWLTFKEDLDPMIRKTLGPFLFENKFCEECEYCLPRPLSPAIDPTAAAQK